MKKANEALPLIIGAKTREDAITAIRKVMELLNLTEDYAILNALQDDLEKFEARYKKTEADYRALTTPRNYESVHEIRVHLNFLYRDIVDALSFPVNKSKIYWEERKTAVRADAMMELNADTAFQEKIKAKSPSALREIYGASNIYREYTNNAAVSYGLYKSLENILTSIRMLTDSISSEERYLLTILNKDVK